MLIETENQKTARAFMSCVADVHAGNEMCHKARANDDLTAQHIADRDATYERLGAFLNSLGNKKPRE